MRGTLSQFTDKSIRVTDLTRVAEGQFPESGAAHAVFLGGRRRHRRSYIHQQIRRLPPRHREGLPHHRPGSTSTSTSSACPWIWCSVETDGKTEDQKVDVVGTDRQYVVDTFGRPRHIVIDPGDWVLKSSP